MQNKDIERLRRKFCATSNPDFSKEEFYRIVKSKLEIDRKDRTKAEIEQMKVDTFTAYQVPSSGFRMKKSALFFIRNGLYTFLTKSYYVIKRSDKRKADFLGWTLKNCHGVNF